MSESVWKSVSRSYGQGLLCTGLLALGSPGLAADPGPAPPVIADLPGAPAFDAPLRKKLRQAVESRPADFEARTQHKRPDGAPRYTNRLALETSPYLLQHSHNPVNWYPWGAEAFAEAKRRQVPLLVSVGYSTCHWCHVMEEESFDDPDVAKLLNSSFVAVKVDRESRPDIDEILMAAVYAMGQRGGWPLNIWLTPDGQPFYGGTYFPPANSPRRPGFRQILTTIAERWSSDPEEIEQLAARVNETVRERLGGSADSGLEGAPEPRHLRAAMEILRPRLDHAWGGLQSRIKFPSSLPIAFLLRYHRRTGDPEALAAAELTLEKMADGGLRDALGGGFHRYSTDRLWRVPHFEKMLYDNALLVPLYIEAFQVTGREDFEAVARSTLDYLAREMQSVQGGFYSATDADSADPDGEMEEGRYFTWTPDEIEAVVGSERAPLVAAAFGVTPKGHLDGRSILHRASSPGELATRFDRPEAQVRSTLAGASRDLLAARQSRIPPLLDDKILAAWNGLAISAFARAGFALDEPRYTEAARKAAGFVLERMRRDGRLLRVYREGRASGPAFLDDYAFVIAGLLDLYEANPDPRWLKEAVALQGVQDSLYADPDGGGYFTTARDHEKLPVRSKPSRDGAVPSGNSVSALNLLRLASFTENADYSRRATALFRAFQEKIGNDPLGVGVLLTAVDYQLDTPFEIMIVLPPSGQGGPPLLSPVRETFVPNRILSVVREGAGFEEHAQIVPLLESKRAINGRATAYVCVNRTCSYPASDPVTLAQQLSATQPLPTPKLTEKAN